MLCTSGFVNDVVFSYNRTKGPESQTMPRGGTRAKSAVSKYLVCDATNFMLVTVLRVNELHHSSWSVAGVGSRNRSYVIHNNSLLFSTRQNAASLPVAWRQHCFFVDDASDIRGNRSASAQRHTQHCNYSGNNAHNDASHATRCCLLSGNVSLFVCLLTHIRHCQQGLYGDR